MTNHERSYSTVHQALDAVRAARTELEARIQEEVTELVERFKQETTISPCSIYINMVETTHMTSRKQEFCVGHVQVEINI